MIPHTYPSTLSDSNQRLMVVYYLSSVTGLERWKDYIPVKESTLASPELNSFSTGGAIYTSALSSTTGLQAWVDYVPVYEDSSATDAWSINALGYLSTKSDVAARAFAIIASYGADAHVYLPGIGTISGLTAGNYLDSAGTTAATVDNPVGLALDANGSVGSELVTNGDFSNSTTGWSAGFGGAISNSSNQLVIDSPAGYGRAVTAVACTIGKTYRYSFTVVSKTSSQLQFGVTNNANGTGETAVKTVAAVGTYTGHFVAAASTAYFTAINQDVAAGKTCTIDNISIKEVTGIHATQATTANKPILRRGAVNYILRSNDYSATWANNSCAFSNTGSAPNGGNSVKIIPTVVSTDHGIDQSIVVPSGAYYTLAALVKQSGYGGFALGTIGAGTGYSFFNLTTGALVSKLAAHTTYSIADAGNGFYLVVVNVITTATSLRCFYNVSSTIGNQTTTGNGVDGVESAGFAVYAGHKTAQELLDTGIILTTTAAASSASGNYKWEFDGTNDSLALGSVPFQMADDHCVIAGFKTNGALWQTIFGQSAGGGSDGLPQLGITAGNTIRYYVNGGGTTASLVSVSAISSNTPYVVSSRVVAGAITLRLNASSIGTGNLSGVYTTATSSLIGAINRPTATDMFSGSLFPTIAIKGTVTDADLLILERFVGTLSGVTI